jgi:hypothetical protein
MNHTPRHHSDAATVVAVLLLDGWHRINPGSFTIDSFGFAGDDDRGTPGCHFQEPTTPTHTARLP